MKSDALIKIVLLILAIAATSYSSGHNNTAYTNETQHNNTTHTNEIHHNNTNHTGIHKGIHIFVNKFANVSTPFIVCCWILLASLAKVVFHYVDSLSNCIPESCLLILLGVPVGFILQSSGVSGHLFLTSDLFFYYLLPPIILDAGYFINAAAFFDNIGTILIYAVIGTILNTFLVGASMYGIAYTANVQISLLNSFLFGSLISAVDPVAVLTVFEEVQVNEVLYMLVFGESVLNDAASVVLYRTFENLPEDNIDHKQVGLAIASFFVVSIFGTIIGVIFGLVASFITKFTDHVRVIEPMFVFLMAYMAYLTAEIFHFSGIMSILFCGVVMQPYVESNISRKSHITIKYFLKLLASSCEAVIFMFLGVALVQYSHNFNIKFIVWCIFFISIFRALCTVLLTWLANKFGRMERVSRVEQFIMSYGGLRGAVAFCLAIVLNDDGTKESKELKALLVTTTLAVIIFTCFGQGATMQMVVEKLGVKRADCREVTMTEHLNDKVMSYTTAGIEEILGVHGHGFWRNLMQVFNQKVMRPCLERNPEMILDDVLFQEERKIEHRQSFLHSPRTDRDRSASTDSITSCESSGSAAIGYTNDGFMGNVRTLSFTSDGNTVTRESTITVIDPKDFAYLIPHAKQIKQRKRYSDSTVGLHHKHWEESHHHSKGTSKRDAFGNIIPLPHRKHHRRHHHGHHHRSKSHHGEQQHHHQHHSHHGQNTYRSQKPDTETIQEEGDTNNDTVDGKVDLSQNIEMTEMEIPDWQMNQLKQNFELTSENKPQVMHNGKTVHRISTDVNITNNTVIDVESVHHEISDTADYTIPIPSLSVSDIPDASIYTDRPVVDSGVHVLSKKNVQDILDAKGKRTRQRSESTASSGSSSSSASSSSASTSGSASTPFDIPPSAIIILETGRDPESQEHRL